MKIEFVKTRNIYHYEPILMPLAKDFGYIFYSTIFEWCGVLKDFWWKHWEFELIHIDNKPVGCCGLYSLNEKTTELWLSWLGLVPELRNKGIGVEILNHLEVEAKKVGCEYLFSYVDKGGAPLNFYKRNGFEIIGTVAEYLEQNKISHIDGDEFEDKDDFVIRKKI